jgi:formyl-CoA transferase
VNGVSAVFMNLNRNKRSIALDLKSAHDMEALRTLVSSADVLVQNFRPGVAERLGIGAATVRTGNPRLIYCAISGFGQSGPHATRGGYDLIAQGMSGLMTGNRAPNGEPRRLPIPISDVVSGIYAAQAISSALVERERTGRGQVIDIALLDVALSLGIYEVSTYLGTGQMPQTAEGHATLGPYQAFRASDGWFTIGAGRQEHWTKLCSALGLPNLVGDERFSSGESRAKHRKELDAELAPAFSRLSRKALLETLEELGIPSGPVNTYEEAFNEPQVSVRRMAVRTLHPEAGEVVVLGSVPKFSSMDTSSLTSAPVLDEHSREIAEQFGLPRKE